MYFFYIYIFFIYSQFQNILTHGPVFDTTCAFLNIIKHLRIFNYSVLFKCNAIMNYLKSGSLNDRVYVSIFLLN